MKSEKCNPRALRGTFVGYDGHTIYRVHIQEQNKVIRIKNLQIFEDHEAKSSTSLPDYENGPTFQGSPLSDEDDDTQILDVGRKVDNTTGTSRQTPSKVTTSRGRKVKNARDEGTGPLITREDSQKKSRTGRTLRPTTKAKNQDLVAHLTKLLSLDWKSESPKAEANAFLTQINKPDDEEDPLQILTSRLLRENATDPGEFAFATQLDVVEPETYNKAMSGSQAQEWSQAMTEELDQLKANET